MSFWSIFAGYSKEFWVLIGLVCVLLEMFMLPGLGLLFVGLGAFSVAAAMFIFPELYEIQYILLIFASSAWLAFFLTPIKHLMNKKDDKTKVQNLIGSTVEVIGQDMEPGLVSQVKWSGTIMNARLENSLQRKVKVGEKLKVVSTSGNILICTYNEPVD